MARGKAKEPGEADPIVQSWISEIEASRQRDKEYRKDGKRIRAIFSGAKEHATPFNILYSNVETIAPSLYSQIPRPVVEYRFKDGNPTAKAAALAAQRLLEFQLDTNIDGYETFNDTMKAAVNDALLPGRGISRVKYDAEVADDGIKQYELICSESESWDRFYCGYAKKWNKVPWIAYEMYIDKKEAVRLFGKDIATKIQFSKGEGEKSEERKDEKHTGERKTALVYKIWDKNGGRKIRFISPQYPEGYLLEQDDPLELTGFFDCPRPLQFVEKTDDMVPTAMYSLYESQAEELNSLTVRIKRITKAIKARGLYDAALGDDIGNLMEADDNALVPSEKGSSLAAEKGLDNAIWFMPVDKLIVVLRELYAAREACKQVIYEVTGISDIVRGASKASETLGAQQIKSQWGTLRIKPKQAEVQRYARDFLRMMLEIAASKFSQDLWARMTGLPYLTDMQAQQAQAVFQAAQQAAIAGDQQAAKAAQQAQAELQKPKWADVLAILQDDIQRAYKIDIETNSTIEPEAAEDQKNISELMAAIGQFLNGVGPLVAQGIMPFEIAQGMLLSITKRFRFGSEIEDLIKQMKPPPPQDDGKAEADKKLQEQAAQEKQAGQQKAMQDAATIAQLKTQLQQKEAEAGLQQQQTDIALREQRFATEKQLFELEKKQVQESIKNNVDKESSKIDQKKQMLGMEQKQAKTEQVVSKSVDSKMSQAVTQMGGMIQQLVETVGQQAKETQALVKAVSAPRKRKAVRDNDGRIVETMDEVLQ